MSGALPPLSWVCLSCVIPDPVSPICPGDSLAVCGSATSTSSELCPQSPQAFLCGLQEVHSLSHLGWAYEMQLLLLQPRAVLSPDLALGIAESCE